MLVVLDASLVVALAVVDRRAPSVEVRLRRLADQDTLHAPSLLTYEVANGLTRLIAASQFPNERLFDAWRRVVSLPISYHPLRDQGETVVRIARRLQRASAYDAAYTALAQDLDAQLWTFDGPLARNARSLGFPVQLVE